MKFGCIIFSVVLLVFSFLLTGCTSFAAARVDREYSIGDTGPAGGIIFFDRGRQPDGGWRFLEVSPSEYEISLPWGSSQVSLETLQGLGAGRSNTETIVQAFSTAGDFDTAAQYSSSVVINGYSDWFLPSKEELNILYRILGMKGLGNFRGVGYAYWSSSQYSRNLAWAQGFSSGVQGRIEKFDTLVVRPVRAF